MQSEQNKLLMIKRRIPDLNPALKKIAKFIVKYPHIVKSSTIKELSDQCKISQASVTRFAREIGLGGFQELKLAIAETLSTNKSVKPNRFEHEAYEDICNGDTLDEIIDKISFLSTQVLGETRNIIDFQAVRMAVSAIEKSRHLLVFCSDSSAVAAESMVFRLLGLGKFCALHKDFSVQEISANLLNKDSLAIGITNSGTSMPAVKGLEIAKSVGAGTICITSFIKSPILKYSDIKLITPVISAFSGHTIYDQSMLSRISQLLVLDILYASYAARNYKKSVAMLEKTWSSVEYSRLK